MNKIIVIAFITIFFYGPSNVIAQEQQKDEKIKVVNIDDAEKKKNFFTDLDNYGFNLSRTVIGDNKNEAAEFAFQLNEWENPIYIINYALVWSSRKFGNIELGPFDSWISISNEGKLSNDNDSAENAWYYALNYNMTSSGRNPTYLALSVKYETDKNFDKIHKIMGGILFSQTIRAIGIGEAIPNNKDSALHIRFRPFIGVDSGYNAKKEDVKEEVEETILRLKALGSFNLYFDFLSNALGMNDIYIDVGGEYYYLPLEKNTQHFAKMDIGFNFMFSDNLSFRVSYAYGYKAPKFEKVDVFMGALGIKF